ncbi:MAG TPA: SdpI family protein [Rhizomicrobium sp.]|jgi:uncharacterized membrane protein
MGRHAPLIGSLIILAVMAGLSLWAWQVLPDDARLVVHWDMDGHPNGYASKAVALLIMPVLALISILIAAALSRSRSERMQAALHSTGFGAIWLAMLVLLAACHAMTIFVARGLPIRPDDVLPLIIGLFFAVTGNFMGKLPPSNFAGIRTPWTRASDYSWEKTHRLAGPLFVAAGLATLIARAVADGATAIHVLLAGLLAAALISSAASYFYWRNDPERAAGRT